MPKTDTPNPNMKQKKIVQIAACGHECVQSTQCVWTVFALDEDGHLWFQGNTFDRWIQIPGPIEETPDAL